MSEALWLAGKDPGRMLAAVGSFSGRRHGLLCAALLARCPALRSAEEGRAVIAWLGDGGFETGDPGRFVALRAAARRGAEAAQTSFDAAARGAADCRFRHADAAEAVGVAYPAEVVHANAAI